ncbi:hypothetical protein [Thiomicrorhabdus indica]|uniref:hypothetical protein n=1 Tax=Thiomicrorhabdus indica TaxID=2267253 RepID=UPI00102D918A|nr:hypothetical protein [Thiomicrorhabdus indica]
MFQVMLTTAAVVAVVELTGSFVLPIFLLVVVFLASLLKGEPSEQNQNEQNQSGETKRNPVECIELFSQPTQAQIKFLEFLGLVSITEEKTVWVKSSRLKRSVKVYQARKPTTDSEFKVAVLQRIGYKSESNHQWVLS